MFSEKERRRLLDIIENIDLIGHYVADMKFEDYLADQRTMDATERCLQRITEASIKIGPDRMGQIAPTVPMARVRGLGNMLRHEYDVIDPRSIFSTVINDLPVLRDACEAAVHA